MRDCLRAAATSFGADIDLDWVLDLWRRFTIDEEALAVVAAVRGAGVRSYLATNQQDVRRDVMRERYAGVFDGSFYSCELGAAKPERTFFHRALTQLSLRADAVVFIDDSPHNIAAARDVGLVAVHHDPSGGAAALRGELRAAGVDV